MLNVVQLIGRIAAEPETKKEVNEFGDIQFDENKISYRLAVSRDYKSRQGEPITDFFIISTDGKLADFAKKKLKKGALVAVAGSIEIYKQKSDSGSKSYPVITASRQYLLYDPEEPAKKKLDMEHLQDQVKDLQCRLDRQIDQNEELKKQMEKEQKESTEWNLFCQLQEKEGDLFVFRIDEMLGFDEDPVQNDEETFDDVEEKTLLNLLLTGRWYSVDRLMEILYEAKKYNELLKQEKGHPAENEMSDTISTKQYVEAYRKKIAEIQSYFRKYNATADWVQEVKGVVEWYRKEQEGQKSEENHK